MDADKGESQKMAVDGESDDDIPLVILSKKSKENGVKEAAQAPPSSPPKKKAKILEDSDDDDVPLDRLVKKSAPSTGKATTKTGSGVVEEKGKKAVSNAEDDDDVPLSKLVAKPSQKPKAAKEPKKESAVIKKVAPKREDEDMDDDDVPLSALGKKKKKKIDDESDSDFEALKNAKQTKKASNGSSVAEKKKKAAPTDGDDSDFEVKKKKVKKEETSTPPPTASKADKSVGGKKEKRDRIKEEHDARHKWWLEEKDLGADEKWKTLTHSGVIFAPLYVPHGVKPLYDGKPVDLTPEQEEYATYYAQYLETDHVKKEVFRNNFWKCWKKLLNPKKSATPHVIRSFDKVDFRPIWSYLEQRKEEKKNRPKEDKEREKAEKQEVQEKYGYAYLDGVKERVGNYRVEPPGLFLGRGAHPKAGMFKLRITPADITINLGEDATPPTPSPPYENEEWGDIIHNNKVTWLAVWRENVNGSTKYVMLHSCSRLKGEADMKKFEVARKLKDNVERIRESYMANLSSKKPLEKQLATAMWVIDHLALRVGNEKGEDEADTVGCCSLRVEHIELVPPSSIQFDFLGKDSMRYFNTVEVDPLVYKNFATFMKGKAKTDDVFDLLTSMTLNSHLKKYMDGLSAKVFRTFNASFTLQKELEHVVFKPGTSVEEKVLEFNRANREVAILCNHQRSQPKQHLVQMEKMNEKIAEIEEEIRLVKSLKKDLKAGGSVEEFSRKRKRDDVEVEEVEGEDGKPEKKKARLPSTPEKCEELVKRLEDRVKKWRIKMTEKDELKTIALSTSKINYIDPRLSVAWCKRNDVPVEKIFSKTLRDKFAWALEVPSDWRF